MDARWMLVALLTTACDPSGPAGLVLEGVLSVDDACVVDPTYPLRAEGVLDTTALPDTLRPSGMAYAALFRLRNYESHAPYAVIEDEDRVYVNRVEVEVRHGGSVLSLNGLPNPFLVAANGSVSYAPRRGSAVGVGAAYVLPAQYAEAIDAALGGERDIELAIHAIATTDDGTMRTSTTLVFPLHFCLGCLVTCAPTGTTEHASCIVGQDDASTVHCH